MPSTLCMPKLSPTMTRGTVARWLKRVGDPVRPGEPILEVATDKATIEYSSPEPGWLREILGAEGTTLPVGKPLAILTREREEDYSGYKPQELVMEREEAQKVVLPSVPRHEERPSADRVAASPLARTIAAREHISLSGIRGSGPGGRIMSRDLEPLRRKGMAAPSFPVPEGATLEPLTPLRQVIAERLQYAKATIPHFYVAVDVEVSALLDQRERLKASGHQVTINDMFLKASALALMDHPAIRSSFIPERQAILRHEHADVAVAVAIPGGLVTPIVLQAETKPLAAISQEVRLLTEKARSGRLLPHEYSGGAFTLTNLGMFGIDEFISILNPPQVAILAVGAAKDCPIVDHGTLRPGKKIHLCLSADHRAVDGSDAARFLQTVTELLANPLRYAAL